MRGWPAACCSSRSRRCCSSAATGRTTRRHDRRPPRRTRPRRRHRRSRARPPSLPSGRARAARSSCSPTSALRPTTATTVSCSSSGTAFPATTFGTSSGRCGPTAPVKRSPSPAAAVLLVRMEPALDADLTQESAPRTYTGPTRFSTGHLGGRRARADGRLRGSPHVGGRRRREAAVPRDAARESGPDRDRRRRQLGRGARRAGLAAEDLSAICALPGRGALASSGGHPYLDQCTEHGAPEVEGLPSD